METLQKVVQSTPQPISGVNISGKETYGYAEGQGSPTPGETASPPNSFQQSPSLPASGLTEFNGADSTSQDLPPDQLREVLATKDTTFTTDVSPKQYMGVRVKMPVRELLRKIRLSKGIDTDSIQEASVKAERKETPGKRGKKSIHSEKRHKLNRHNPQPAMKSMEDLDILVEVLEEDLNKSHSRREMQRAPQTHLEGAFPEVPPHCREGDGNQQPDGNSWDSTKFEPHCPFPDSSALGHGYPKHFNGSDAKMRQPCLDPMTPHLYSHMEARHKQGRDPFLRPMGNFQGFAEEVGPQYHSSPGHVVSESLENNSVDLHEVGQSKPSSGNFGGQDASAISFFQFQLRQEERRLRCIPQDRLLAPDANGNRLLHKAVAQGRRALAYALAWRLALLNRIDEENARKQTALHVAAQKNHHLIVSDLVSLGANVNKRDGSEKTPLHLCAEKGYSRVVEVLKSCQKGGTHLEVDATDNQGLTPLQCAALAHCAIVTDLEKSSVSPEAQTLLTLRKDLIWSGIACLLEMGADPWVQGTKSSSQASNYVAKVQENNKLMSFLQARRPKWQEESAIVPGPDGMAIPYLQGDLEPHLLSFAGIFQHFSEGILYPEGSISVSMDFLDNL
ncbi:NF-kappa-B inhibitor zeta-like [Eublepharis macularius]|uniref:NF-kappa-B inhibitor zeta-like n=1 Tax=Eublepharis macularius TaxID=481883 RepID=A0AA97K9F8_EUBMA|nr:NF-kappa-B inhibitor zeta-like [Eublepharis macularius]